ncbi:MAG: hypothetical protein WKF79_13520 [Nocardioides sp.]
MSTSPTAVQVTSERARSPWPTWVRWLVLVLGLGASAVAGYLSMVASMIVAVMVGAAPLLAGDSTPEQPWVTPVAVGAALVGFGLPARLAIRIFLRHRSTPQ